MLAAAAAEDAGRFVDDAPKERVVDDPEPVEKKPAEKPNKDAAASKEKSVSEADKDKEPKDPKKSTAQADSAAAEPTEGKAKSKWQQNEERKNKTWSEINAEKDAIKAQQQALQREKAEVQRKAEDIERAKVTAEPIRDEHGFTAKDYRDVAKDMRKAGTHDQAEAAEKLASNLDAKQQKLIQERNVADLRANWQRSYDELSSKTEYAELKDETSELHMQTMSVLKQFPFLAYQADGLQQAVTMAETRVSAKSSEGTKSELAKLKEEHAKLQKKLTIGGGSPTNLPEEDTPFEKLSSAEQKKRLEQAARASDRDAGFE